MTFAGDEQVSDYPDAAAAVAAMSPQVRYVWWRATDVRSLARLLPIARCWDVAAVHRLVAGGSSDDPAICWATVFGLEPVAEPEQSVDDLFASQAPSLPIRDGVALPPDAGSPARLTDPDHRAAYARAALTVARRQAQVLWDRVGERACAISESGAALLSVELANEGLPVDREVLEELIGAAAGPRPATEEDAVANRRLRDEIVWRRAPGRRPFDLRNPAAVREALRSAGVIVDDTRAWHLEPYRAGSPLVDALLTWRKAERIATTYGWHWIASCIGADDRLRGEWEASDGGAGRMTAGSGLHSLPTPLRPGIVAAPGHLFVRADLGQIEPRVLAVVARDPQLAAATRADDLYASVATELGVDRPSAKIAMLAAMYGQTSGNAGQVVAQFERSYPVSMAFLRKAAAEGEAGRAVTTYGGRRVPVGVDPTGDVWAARARGRFTRNAVVQGAAAELFKAWALTVRAAVEPLGARIVLCLHDELLVHAPQEQAPAVAAAVDQGLADAARRWSQGSPVRFVADTRVMRSWSEAKD
ncbi:DNA polymerase [Calidifontibacter terrae]